MLENPNSTSGDVANLISKDQSSVSKILKAANSSFYAIRGRIDTVSQAIFHIGFDEVKNLIIAMGIMDIFNNTKVIQVMNPVDFWKHSIAVGVFSRLIAQNLGITKLENYFIAGVLHDIGKVFLLKFFGNDFARAINLAREKNLLIKEAEVETLGISHTAIGEIIAEQWRLPGNLKAAVSNHTTGIVGGKIDLLVAVVHLADIAARMYQLGNPGDCLVPAPNRDVLDKIELPPKLFSSIYKQVLVAYSEATNLFLL
jgi:HD-like signal output (HDOD) protein